MPTFSFQLFLCLKNVKRNLYDLLSGTLYYIHILQRCGDLTPKKDEKTQGITEALCEICSDQTLYN